MKNFKKEKNTCGQVETFGRQSEQTTWPRAHWKYDINLNLRQILTNFETNIEKPHGHVHTGNTI